MVKLKYLIRFALLAIGFGLTTFGLMTWQAKGFAMAGVWFEGDSWAAHPLHGLVLGIAMIPPTLWEIFVLENKPRTSGSPS